MDLLPSEGGTGAYDTALHNKARVICGALAGEYTFGFLHVKAVDDAGHDRNMPLKVQDSMDQASINLFLT